MSEAAVHPFWILLGKSASEPVPSARLAFYKWLAKQILPRQKTTFYEPTESISLSFEDIQTHTSFIQEWLLAEEPESDEALILIDLSRGPYAFMREPFLLHVAEAAVQLATPEGRKVVIALPGRAPASSSLLWVPLDRSSTELRGSVLVVDRRGDLDCRGVETAVAKKFSEEYRKRAAELDDDPSERFDSKLLRRMGHFDLGACGGPEGECSNYFFDAEDCIEELATLLERRVGSIRGKSKKESWVIVPCAPETPGWKRPLSLSPRERGWAVSAGRRGI